MSLTLSQTTILHDVSVAIEPGEFSVLIGPNGAGKSSLLSVLCGDQTPTKGQVTLNGKSLASIPIQDQAALRAVMLPRREFAFGFSVSEVLEMGWVDCTGQLSAHRERSIADVVAACGIEAFLNRDYRLLSSGEQQRVHLAKTVLQIWVNEPEDDPRYLLLDEPTENLDVAHVLETMSLLAELTKNGVGVLAVLHDLSLAARYADKAHLMCDGSVLKTGETADVFDGEVLSSVYQTPIRVEHHEELDRFLILT